MRFLGDMGVSMRVIEWLRTAGHDVVHLRDEGLQRLPNGDILRHEHPTDRRAPGEPRNTRNTRKEYKWTSSSKKSAIGSWGRASRSTRRWAAASSKRFTRSV